MALFKMNSGYMVFHIINCRFDYTILQNGVWYMHIFFLHFNKGFLIKELWSIISPHFLITNIGVLTMEQSRQKCSIIEKIKSLA